MGSVNSKFWTHRGLCAEIIANDGQSVSTVDCESPFALIGSRTDCDIVLPPCDAIPDRAYFVCYVNGQFFGLNINARTRTHAKFMLIDPVRGIRLGKVRVKFCVSEQNHDDHVLSEADRTRTHILRWQENGKRRFVRLAKNKPLLVGRISSSICVDEPAIGNVHCLVVQTGGQLWVVDLTDGVTTIQVHNEQVGVAALSHRDRFEVNGIRFGFFKIKSEDPQPKSSESDARLAQWETELKLQQTALATEAARLVDQRTKLDAMQVSLDSHKTEFDQACKERENDLTWQIDEFEEAKRTWTAEKEEQQQSFQAAQAALNAMRAELQEQNAELKNDLRKAMDELEELRQSRREMIVELNRQREAMLAQQIQAQADLQHRDNQLSERQEEMDARRKELAVLESRLEKEREAFLAQLRRTVNVDAVQSDLEQSETWTQDAHDVLGSREFSKILNRALDQPDSGHSE